MSSKEKILQDKTFAAAKLLFETCELSDKLSRISFYKDWALLTFCYVCWANVWATIPYGIAISTLYITYRKTLELNKIYLSLKENYDFYESLYN